MNIDVLAQDIGKLINKGSNSVLIEAYRFQIDLKAKTEGSFLSNLLHETANRITYTPEPEGRDDWQEVETTLLKKIGDCEDFTILIGAVLLHAGYPVLLKFTASKDLFDHVYPITWDGKEWVALDATLNNVGLGNEGSYVNSVTYNLNGRVVSSFEPMSYLGWVVAVIVFVIFLLRMFLRD